MGNRKIQIYGINNKAQPFPFCFRNKITVIFITNPAEMKVH